jgi:hypothetical protein
MNIGEAINAAVTTVTKDWTSVKKKTLRDQARGDAAYWRMMRGRRQERSIKELAYSHMRQAYAQAAGSTGIATSRQVMYQARPLILADADTGKTLDAQYFCQNLLPTYVAEHPAETADWDVVYDARGHLWEPHTDHEVALGTLEVRRYLAERQTDFDLAGLCSDDDELPIRFPTRGPTHRYRNVLFIEKEGFMPILRARRLAQRFDLAIMSPKGLSTTATRHLMEALEVRFLVLHDFDKSGFSIIGTLRRNTARYHFRRPPEIVDLGLRLADVVAEGLSAEPVSWRDEYPEANLRKNGATEAEITFLVRGRGHGQRVELNSLSSDRFLAWLEEKLVAHGVEKVVPPADVLKLAYRRAIYVHGVNARLASIREEELAAAEQAKAPRGLAKDVKAIVARNPMLAWDEAVSQIAAAGDGRGAAAVLG